MSTKDNQSVSYNNDIAKRTQKILKEQGYEVKLGHIFELYSKLSGVKDWNSAKALKKNFKTIIQSTKNVFNLGFKTNDKKELVPNLKSQKEIFNIIFCGGPNTNAKLSMKNTLLTALNDDKSSLGLIFSESSEENNDGQLRIKSFDFFEKEINTLYKEVTRRLNLNENELEKEPSIFIGIEDLEILLLKIDYYYRSDKENSPAFLLKKILRINPKSKIYFLCHTERPSNQSYPRELRIYFNYYTVFKLSSKEDSGLIDITEKILNIKADEPYRAYDGNGDEISFDHIKDINVRLDVLLESKSGATWNLIYNKLNKENQFSEDSPVLVLKKLGFDLQTQENKMYPISFIIKNKDKKIGIYIPTDKSNVPKAQIPFIELAKKHLNLDEIWFYNNDNNYVDGNYLDNQSNLKLKSIFSKFIVLDDIKQTTNILSNIDNLSLEQKNEVLELLPIKI